MSAAAAAGLAHAIRYLIGCGSRGDAGIFWVLILVVSSVSRPNSACHSE